MQTKQSSKPIQVGGATLPGSRLQDPQLKHQSIFTFGPADIPKGQRLQAVKQGQRSICLIKEP